MRMSQRLGKPENRRGVEGEVEMRVGTERVEIGSVRFQSTQGYAAACMLQLYQFGFGTFIQAASMMDDIYMRNDMTRLINSKLRTLLEDTSIGPEIISQNADMPVCKFVERQSQRAMEPHTRIPISHQELVERITRTRGQVI